MKNKKYILTSISILIFMVLLACFWNYECNKIIDHGARCFFVENRWNDIIFVTSNVPKEELEWRLIPILFSSMMIILIKKKWLKRIFIIMSAVVVIAIQIKFGVLHWNPILEPSCINSIIIQGGSGMIFATAYTTILIYVFKRIQEKSKIKRLIKSNMVACCASVVTHLLSNIFIVFTQTF